MITNQTFVSALEKLEAILKNEEIFPIAVEKRAVRVNVPKEEGPKRETIKVFEAEELKALRLFLLTEITLFPNNIIILREKGSDLEKRIKEELKLRELMKGLIENPLINTNALNNFLNLTPNIALSLKKEGSPFRPLLEAVTSILEINPSPTVSIQEKASKEGQGQGQGSRA